MWAETLQRARRALTLDETLFREVAEDPHATGPALAVVLGTALAGGLGRLFGEGIPGVLAGLGQGCLVWALWLAGVQGVARALGTPVDLARLFRVLGFGATAFALALLEPLPFLGLLVSIAKWILVFAAFVTGLRVGLGLETSRAAVLAGGGFLIALLLLVPVAWVFPGL